MPYKDKKKQREIETKSIARNRARKRTIIIAAKNKPCADCQNTFPFFVMEFDHVSGKKLFSLNRGHLMSVERLLAEIAKCEVVCANCHHVRSYVRVSQLAEERDSNPRQ